MPEEARRAKETSEEGYAPPAIVVLGLLADLTTAVVDSSVLPPP